MPLTTENFHLKPSTCSQALALTCSALFDGRSWDSNLYPQVAQDLKFTSLTQYLFAIQADWPCYYLIPSLKCNSSPDKHAFLYLFPDSLCIIIHFSAYPTTIRTRVLCLFAQVCKWKNPISEPSLDLAVILVTSRYEDNTLPVNSEQ